MCPSCYRNMVTARLHFSRHPEKRRAQERQWQGEIDPDLEIVSFHEIPAHVTAGDIEKNGRDMSMPERFQGLKVAPYYGCMSMFPPSIRPEIHSLGLMEKQLAAMGLTVVNWGYRRRCCGTFLTVTRPDITEPLVNRIIDNAREFGADCLVTACAMCQLNLEIRCTLKHPLPTFHFSELIALSLGSSDYEPWFSRHLIDPRPL
jgi:heterodisulfide reductase subunit B2